MISLRTKKFTEKTAGHCDIIDITPRIHQRLSTAFVSRSTAALTTIEHKSGLIQDLKEFLERLIRSDRRHHHDHRWGDNTGFSHVRAALFGRSIAIPIVKGKASLGTWPQVTLVDFNNRSCTREVTLQLIGEPE